ncbi:MAG: DoxX family protein [Candidatus Marinimicrobia bacterium]|nr:DoxX family protein [Candidatus Neomarinimicrobiota bacterium]
MNSPDRYLIVTTRIILGAVFLWASFGKILEPGDFARSISNYHIVPFGIENIIALILPWLELLIGMGLILGIMVDGSVQISAILLIMFILMIGQAMLRGFNIECGCGLKEGEMIGLNKILENIVFIGGAYIVMQRRKRFFEIFPKTPLSE